MKDLIGREVQVGNYIAYALTAGRSANLGIYKVKEILEDKIKAIKIDESYGMWSVLTKETADNPSKKIDRKYAKWSSVVGGYIEMSKEEKQKVDNKTSTLSMSERIFVLDNFTPALFENKE